MPQIILKDAIAERIIAQAQRKGFATPEEYVAHLIQNADADDIAFYEDEIGLGFKEAYKEALRGEGYTYEEYKRMMAEDD